MSFSRAHCQAKCQYIVLYYVLSARNLHTDIIEQLVRGRANIHATDIYECTPLHEAAKVGFSGVHSNLYYIDNIFHSYTPPLNFFQQ